MKYYSIEPALNAKVLGNYPQVKNIKFNCHVWDEPKFIEHTHFTKINFEPITANAVLYAKSNITDLISVTGMGFTLKPLISEKLKTILEKNRKTGLQFFKSPVIHQDKIIDTYYVLNMYEVDMSFIDFKKSEVYLTENTFNLIEKLKIKSYAEFITEKSGIDKKGYPFGIHITKFNFLDDLKQDFFLIQNIEGGSKYIVSEKLKIEIEESDCTGIEFKPVELSLNEWLHEEREKVYGKA
ncbi:hypothetical protein D0809_15010 [Flavobacterium circumlabens]|uniref:Immunity MXAN-0049 protein domain-containing protein n=1 Tax=Flavobacterium circumlabens TaxID=2133765 RepID=A0A4Y7UAN1_9FLAO|nr:DUF1629 domain-containing protein [Flavobacterium circumlabens]TCN56442.1 hypothetical protein EV142_105220 [Flavobacterium circumlabens]TEB43470.1 hypothetical protein D0809_15010 [Flavobacterium circumlabens]